MSANTTELILGDKGVMRRTITEAPVANVEQILAEAAATVPNDIPSVFTSPHDTAVHMRSTRQRIVLYFMMKQIRFNTIWRPYGEGSKKVFPFGQKGAEADFGATFEWEPYGIERYPKKPGEAPTTKAGDMFVYFIFTTIKQGTAWTAGENYLVATRKGDKKLYRLPLHNIFEDARICMGDSFTLQGRTLKERFDNAFGHFNKSAWNTHIAEAAEKMQALFSFDLKGKQVPAPEDWNKYCNAVSNANYSDLPGLIIP